MQSQLGDTLDKEETNRDYEPNLTSRVEEHNERLDEMSSDLSDKGYNATTTSTFIQVKSRLFLRSYAVY